jgi:gamma-polyglutamate biosynthesis protein CapC
MPLLLPEAIGAGLLGALLFGELFGLTAGGMVVPGYMALELDTPVRVLATFACALLILLITRGADKLTLLYGRRRFALTLLLSFVVGLTFNQLFDSDLTGGSGPGHAMGFIVPGLLAHWMESQGILVTSAGLIIVSVLVHLGLVAAFGGSIPV